MNYLAHTVLSTTHIDYQLANLIADTLKGKPWAGCSQQHRDGLNMHRIIDRFTDEHLLVKQAKVRLGNGYLKGVITDIMFDHFLSKHWAQFVRVDFDCFINNFYQAAAQQQTNLPPAGAEFIERLIRYDFFHLYSDFGSLTHVLDKLNQRLSPRLRAKESATDYVPALTQHYFALEDDFLQFFPLLIVQFITANNATSDKHYLSI